MVAGYLSDKEVLARHPNRPFIGIRFQDGLDRTHYGWIRCDAPDSGRVLVIKDYAYETQAGVGIIAGDMGEPVGIQTENKLLFLSTPTRHKSG